jgi:hypothetical protein
MLAKTVAGKAAIENFTARVEEACAAEEKKIWLRLFIYLIIYKFIYLFIYSLIVGL